MTIWISSESRIRHASQALLAWTTSHPALSSNIFNHARMSAASSTIKIFISVLSVD
jgi:hypothetical protein